MKRCAALGPTVLGLLLASGCGRAEPAMGGADDPAAEVGGAGVPARAAAPMKSARRLRVPLDGGGARSTAIGDAGGAGGAAVAGDAAPVETPPPASAGTSAGEVSGPGYRGFVAPPLGPGSWQPTPEDIAKLEAATAKALDVAVRDGRVPSTVDLTTYTRRYSGRATGGRHVIQVSYYCPAKAHLARGEVNVRRGGACIVTGTFDLDKGVFAYFRANNPG